MSRYLVGFSSPVAVLYYIILLCPDVMCEVVLWCGAHTVYNYMSMMSAAVDRYSTRVGWTRARVTRAAANHSQRSIFTAKTQFSGQIKSHFGRCAPFPETHAIESVGPGRQRPAGGQQSARRAQRKLYYYMKLIEHKKKPFIYINNRLRGNPNRTDGNYTHDR